MMTRKHAAELGLLLVAAAWGAVALAQNAASSPADADRRFASKAGAASKAEIEMGRLALSRSHNAAIHAFGQQMIDDHQAAYDGLAQVAARKGLAVPTEPEDRQKRAAAELERMSGPDFDRSFADTMVRDHREVVALFTNESLHGRDPDLAGYAGRTLPTLEQHLQMATRLDAQLKSD